MKVFCLGGAGKICREAALDWVEFADFERLTIGDVNEAAGMETVAWLNDPRVDFARVDLRDKAQSVKQMTGYDVVMDGTTISLNDASTSCIAEAGANGINLNGFGDEYKYDEIFRNNGKVCVPGFGMTPGTTNMMAVFAANQLDSVDTVRVSHGAFRPIAFSASIAETTTYEYDPALPGRMVFEDGEFKQVPPFARPREITLPEPYGTHTQYIIPHSETVTLAEFLKPKGVRLIEVRGTWPPQNMALIKALYDYGFMRNDKIKLNGAEFGVMDAIAEYLIQSEEGQNTQLYGYALHVEVEGVKDGQKKRHTLTHTHPSSDGSEPGWEKLRSYTRCVGIPMAIGAQLIAQGKTQGAGALIPEKVFNPSDVFNALKQRRIEIHETIETLE
ncbi:saccharopine dehydrogenase NADP-binding domain-containing protein [bacterium]|nr:saccharopine dehydrogenase NADP-binding domain-containing protein [bacterium]